MWHKKIIKHFLKKYNGVPLIIQFYLREKTWMKKQSKLACNEKSKLLGLKSLLRKISINKSHLNLIMWMMNWPSITNIS
jgi:hypothetical protein